MSRHPHLIRCPHCGRATPRIDVEWDALVTSQIITQPGSGRLADHYILMESTKSISYLDTIEYTFSCCGTEVVDAELVSLLEGMCRQ